MYDFSCMKKSKRGKGGDESKKTLELMQALMIRV
jgi:hypothetical protein